MKSMIQKELVEVSVLVVPAFLIVTAIWLSAFRFESVLLAPQEDPIAAVMAGAGIAGIVLGYLQFSAERWRGKFGYLLHRGGGHRSLFTCKVIVGLLATAAMGLGPPLVFVLKHSLSPNGSILQWSRVGELACASSIGAAAFGVGVLASQVRRRLLTDLFLLGVAGGGLFLLVWATMLWPGPFVAVHFALGAVLLATSFALLRRGADGDLPLPRGAHLALAAIAPPLLVLPLVAGVVHIEDEVLSELRQSHSAILRERSTGEIFAVALSGKRWHRLSADGELGAANESWAPWAKSGEFDLLHWPAQRGWNEGLLQDPVAWSIRGRGFDRGWEPVQSNHWSYGGAFFLRGVAVPPRDPERRPTLCFLDREVGVLRVFELAVLQGSTDGSERWTKPVALEIQKPAGRGRFSPDTVVLEGPSYRDIEAVRARELSPDVLRRRTACLVDPADGTLWRVDPEDLANPLVEVPLPGGDRFVRLDWLYDRTKAIIGRLEPRLGSFFVLGEKGVYAWSEHELRAYEIPDDLILASEAETVAEVRVHVVDADPIAPKVEIRDGRGENVLFAHEYAPRAIRPRLLAVAAYGATLLRPPLANVAATMASDGLTSPQAEPPRWFFDPLLAGGRRLGLLGLGLIASAVSTGVALPWLRRRGADATSTVVWASFVALVGPIGLLVAWLFEPREQAQHAASAAPAPALVLVERRA